MSPSLVPEQRTDATGRTQRRWVRSGAPGRSTAALPGPAAPAQPADAESDALARVLRRAMPESAESMFEGITNSYPDLADAYRKAAAYADESGDDAAFTALIRCNAPGDLILMAAEDMALLDGLAALPSYSHLPERDRFRKALGRLEDVYRRYWGQYASGRRADTGKLDPAREAPRLRAAAVAGALGVTSDRGSMFDEHAQIECVRRETDLFDRNLAALESLAERLLENRVRPDAETLALLCRAKEEHRIADFGAVAEAAVERRRLDPDEALRILLADAPALADGVL